MENRELNLDILLDEITEVDQAKTDIKMLLAAKIAIELDKKGWIKKDLKDRLGLSSQSIITKWLSGTTNFTVDTLVEIELALGISFFNLEVEETQTIISTEPVHVEFEDSYNDIFKHSQNNENVILVNHSTPLTGVDTLK